MTEFANALATASHQPSHEIEGYQRFTTQEFPVEGIGVCKLQLEYYPLQDLQYDPVRVTTSRLDSSISLMHEADELGQIAFVFKVTGPNQITVSPDLDILDKNQGLGLGRQLLMLTDNAIEHAIITFPQFQGIHVMVRITDQSGERTREAESRSKIGKPIRRDGWTSFMVQTYLQGFTETSQPDEYPRTFVKHYR